MNQLERDIAIARRIKEIENLYNNLIENVGTIKGIADENRKQLSRVLNLPKGDKGNDGGTGPRGLTGKSGKDGVDGKDGYTPVKGKDYYTPQEEEGIVVKTMARIRQPIDGENAVVDEEKIAELAVSIIKDKQLLTSEHIQGLRGEISSYRNQMAMKQAGQHGGGDTIVAGSGITLTRNANGTTTITAIAGGGSVTDVSVVSANGFTGSVANSTTTPTITLTTSVTGILKGNGTAMSAAGAGDVDSILPTQTGQNGKYLTTDGTNSSWGTIAGGGNVSNTGTPLDNQIAVWTSATVIEGTTGLTYNGSNLQLTGDIGSTGTRITKGWFTDLQVTNAIVGSITGNAATVTTNANLTGPITSVGNATSVASQTGTGSTFVMNTAPTFATSITGSYLTASEILITDGSKNIVSAPVATYPSLTELTYVKGVTSSIQTQLNAKQATITFGTGVLAALAVNIGSAGAPVLFNGALGTPSSGTVTNLTGTASININGTVGATTPTTGVFTTLVAGSTTSLLLGTAGSSVGNIGFRNATSGTITLAPVTGALGTVTLTLPAITDTLVTLTASQTLTNKTLTSPGIGGTALLAEGAGIGLDPALSADGTWSGITMTGTAGYTQAFGDLVYLDPTDSRWEAADANAASGADGDARGMLAMVVVAGTDGAACTLLLQGNIRADAKFATFTVNNPLYVSETAGAITQTQVTTTDAVIRVVGAALTADSIYFNPDFFYITHT